MPRSYENLLHRRLKSSQITPQGPMAAILKVSSSCVQHADAATCSAAQAGDKEGARDANRQALRVRSHSQRGGHGAAGGGGGRGARGGGGSGGRRGRGRGRR